jgi:hypothetical protein
MSKIIECQNLAFINEPRLMLEIGQRFDKHSSCHLQDKYVGLAFSGSLCKVRLPKNTPNQCIHPPVAKAQRQEIWNVM